MTLAPGQVEHVTLQVAARAFQYWDTTAHGLGDGVGRSHDRRRLFLTRHPFVRHRHKPLRSTAQEGRGLLAGRSGRGGGDGLSAKVEAIQAAITANQTSTACRSIVGLKAGGLN